MPADEVAHVADLDGPRVRTGPRHAAPKKPLFTRFNMPAGKAIALAAMPTAVLMGMGFTPKLALADEQPASRSLPADEYADQADQYKDCVAALDPEASEDASPTPSPSASASESESAEQAEPSPSTSSDDNSSDGSGTSGEDSSSDSGSDDGSQPKPSPSSSAPAAEGKSEAEAATPSPSASESNKGVLDTIGDAITGVVDGITGGGAKESASPTPSPSASPSGSADAPSGNTGDSGDSGSSNNSGSGKDTSDAAEDAAGKVTDTVEDTVGEVTDEATESADPADEATATPSPSASSTVDPEDCPKATDAEGGVDNPIAVADDPWYLEASYLDLQGADYQGIVEVRTASGKTKKVLKYVISGGTKIGDLHQIVKDKQIGKTYHVQAAKGSESTITDGETVMYTESISGNLLGLVPLTFSPEHPPPLNLPWIYFTNVKVTQAAQFGGTLTIPGMHVFTTD
ncbi:hypothetical protein SSP24_80980 [Streptomyces spinoverrucosus]|uniref:Membrane-bound hydrophilic protein n=1 Tax=Streptomyces spinoverrucosus TaxID=284043 RepID=A0A4Y3VUX5_9ACTN|nr:hypothetical protein [Streptomyces spinoverrucosus]GEC10443.1 hypothetical protein SSP24_80980 [Streptomyces spinoverrucosus]GHB91370.1 hypothetical protein GCM10010397_74570 [Streptomyces spinoverrucosus]